MTNEYINTILAGLRHCGSEEFCDSCPAGELCSSEPGAHICTRAADVIEELRKELGRNNDGSD